MSRSHRGKLWKKIGIGCIFLITVVAVGLFVREYRLRKQFEILYKEAKVQLEGYEELDNTADFAKEDVRQIFVSEAELAEHLVAGNRIDVRIRYDNAEDYLILSDKMLIKCEAESGMVLELSEEEILLLSSAIADGQRYEGTRIYAVSYPENQQLEAGTVTYIANENILRMLGRETTEGESRIALEQRLKQIKQ